MRFFSNDARESSDDQTHDEGPDRVRSEPVAVPNQRPPSPWSNTPPAADATNPADTDRRDVDTGADADGVADRDETDTPPFHEPSPQPTAFGASTVGGAVAASATANPENDRWHATDRDSAADTGVGDDAGVAPGDGVITSTDDDAYAGRGTVTAPDTVPATWTEQDARDRKDDSAPDGVVDVPLDDRTGAAADAASSDAGPSDAASSDAASSDAGRDANRDESVTSYDDSAPAPSAALKDDGDFTDPKAVDPAAEAPLDSSRSDDDAVAADAVTGSAPLKDEGGFDAPQAVDPATGTPPDTDSAAPVVAAVPVAAAAAGTPATGTADTLFSKDDARTFQERWRDVQLRFVDSPKDAAGDAAALVDEAVEKLTASLRSQRAGLDNDTDDTEQLRVQLRGYRDMLNRLLSL